MASTFNPALAVPPRQPAFNAPSTTTAPTVPTGTFVPGTKVQVGGHRVVIVRYLSEGGFAHVYLVRLPKPINGDDEAVLKRVAVPDKEALASMRTEVETMKKLRDQRYIVTYIDSHASALKAGGFEVFLLMEYCNGGGLIDFMNTRLQNRLTESEILKIFSDTALGVACMHYLKPPLLHRDLKVENILITSSATKKNYKLCDFGSAAPPRPAATSAAEGRLIEEDVQKHTTLQYRSPEMIDVYRKQPIDEKSDIWALGVLLYKLCYYKTPFEDQGQMAILNASFKFPGYPSFSDNLKKLIASMLRENPQARPNVYQVIREVSHMRGTDVPIKDIYTARTQSEARRHQRLPLSEPEVVSPLPIGASKALSVEEKFSIPSIQPMRRGRPTKTESDQRVAKPSPSPLRVANGDPFTALDSTADLDSSSAIDKIASRFPALDEFSLLHESSDEFAFDTKFKTAPLPSRDISQRVTNALADDAFAQPAKPSAEPRKEPLGGTLTQHVENNSKPEIGKAVSSTTSNTTAPPYTHPSRSKMVSTGTMTSPDPSPASNIPTLEARPIFRIPPSSLRSSSQPRASDASLDAAALLKYDSNSNKRPGLLDHRPISHIGSIGGLRSSLSSGTSLNVQNTTSTDLSRSRSDSSKIRPSGVQMEPKRRSLRSRAHSKELLDSEGSQSLLGTGNLSSAVTGESDKDATNISSNVEFLKAMEEEDPSKRKEKRLSSGSKHIKRASMPSISLSGTKNLLAGRFGEAFRRFETNTVDSGIPPPALSPDPEGYNLTPIAGSEATDGRSDDGQAYDEIEPAAPEARRELERRRLSQEEKRVADAGAAYRQRLAEVGDGRKDRGEGPINPRAASIQSKVKSLLDESGRGSPSPTTKPERYGRFTDPQYPEASRRLPSPSPLNSQQSPRKGPTAFRVPPRTGSLPGNSSSTTPLPSKNFRSSRSQLPDTSSDPSPRPTFSPLPIASAPATPRPSAPPKPQALRTGNQQPLPKPSPLGNPNPLPTQPLIPPQASQPQPTHPPSRSQPPPQQRLSQPLKKRSSNPYREAMPSSVDDPPAPNDPEDWESTFSKRYPTLAGLEMVETEINGRYPIGSPPPPPPLSQQQQTVGGIIRVKDV
ncbi:MAG: hypothetical protein Q9182_003764 [Xanthomendoza sp. 2 TL-2023]